MEVTSTELCFIIAQGKVKHSSAAPHMHLKIFSLRSIFFSILHSYNILFPLRRSLRIVTCMLNKPATGYSKIATANNRTRAWLFQQSMLLILSISSNNCLTVYPTNQPTNPFTIQNISLYRQPEGLVITTLWACPNSNPKP